METDIRENNERSYIAFISYRHTPLDRETASRVQKRIERFIVPKELREESGRKHLGMCFRDEDELPASSSLTDSIYYALDHSEFLVVICSPDLPLSKWCEAEIRYFLKTHDRGHLLAVLVDGTPAESFSPYMLHDFDDNGNIVKEWEPLAANIASGNHNINNKAFKKETTRLCAAMIGCSFDDLWQREKRANAQRFGIAAAGAVAVMAVFLGVVLNRNAEIEERNAQITMQNEQIREQNEEIEVKNTELQTQLSTVLVDSGLNKLENFDRYGALEDALAALESNDPAVYDHRAEKLLSDALGAYSCGKLQSTLVYKQTTDIVKINVTGDNKYVLILDMAGTLRAHDMTDLSIVWEIMLRDQNAEIYPRGSDESVIVKTADEVICLSVSDGSVIWKHEQNSPNYFHCMSDDGSLFTVLDTDPDDKGRALYWDTSPYPSHDYFLPVYAVFLDTHSGEELFRLQLEGDEEHGFMSLTDDFLDDFFAVDFSDDNSKFVCVLPFRSMKENTPVISKTLFVADVDARSLLYSGTPLQEGDNSRIPFDIWFGTEIDNKAENILLIQNESLEQYVRLTRLLLEGNEYTCTSSQLDFYFGSDTLSLYDIEDNIKRTRKMLSSANHLVFFTDKDIAIVDKKDFSLVRSFRAESLIVSAEWCDKDSESLQVVTEKGSVLFMTISNEEGWVLDHLEQFDLEQNDLWLYASVKGGIAYNKTDGAGFVVRKSSEGQLLYLNYASDPQVTALAVSGGGTDITSSDVQISFLPDSDTGMLLMNYDTVWTFDRNSGEIIRKTKTGQEFSHGEYEAIVLDEGEFVQGNLIYSAEDGSVSQYITDSEEIYDGWFDSGIYWSKRADNGDILTVGMCYYWVPDKDSQAGIAFTTIYHLWKNGEYQYPVAVIDQSDFEVTLPEVYENGMIMIYGDIYNDDREALFTFIDSSNGIFYYHDNDFSADMGYKTAYGSSKTAAAVLYENGVLELLSFNEDGTYDIEQIGDEDKERFTAQNEALSICFAEGNRYLAMLSSAGRLAITDLEMLEAQKNSQDIAAAEIFDGTVGVFRDNMSDVDNFVKADMTEDRNSMIISSGYINHFCNAALIDTSTWTLQAEIHDYYTFDADNNKIYFYTDNADGQGSSGIMTCPMHDLEELMTWAQRTLDERP